MGGASKGHEEPFPRLTLSRCKCKIPYKPMQDLGESRQKQRAPQLIVFHLLNLFITQAYAQSRIHMSPIGCLQSDNMLNIFLQDGFFGFYFWTNKQARNLGNPFEGGRGILPAVSNQLDLGNNFIVN